MVAWIFSITGAPPDTGPGAPWTQHKSQAAGGGGNISGICLARFADAGDVAAGSFAFTGGPGAGFLLSMIDAYTGVNPTAPVTAAAQGGAGSSATITIPSITPSADDGLFAIGMANGNDLPAPGGFTQNAAESAVAISARKLYTTAAASGSITAAISSNAWCGIGIALDPVPSARPRVLVASGAVQRAARW